MRNLPELKARKRTKMSDTFSPGPTPNTVRSDDGKIITVPDGWILVPPGDPALTRRIKAADEYYAVAEKKVGRFSQGVSGLRRRPSSKFVPILKPSDQLGALRRKRKQTPDAEIKPRPNMLRTFLGRSWSSLVFILPIPISLIGWLVPSLTMPRQLAVGLWPEQNASRSSSVPKPPLSPGCGTKRPATTAW